MGIKFSKFNLLITYHPVTLEKETSQKYFQNLLDALSDLNDIYLNHMPLTHVSGICIFYRALYLDFMMVVNSFDSKNYINNINEKI